MDEATFKTVNRLIGYGYFTVGAICTTKLCQLNGNLHPFYTVLGIFGVMIMSKNLSK